MQNIKYQICVSMFTFKHISIQDIAISKIKYRIFWYDFQISAYEANIAQYICIKDIEQRYHKFKYLPENPILLNAYEIYEAYKILLIKNEI